MEEENKISYTAEKLDEEESSEHHSLGLHHLYKAAFSDQYKKDEETYEIYQMKPLAYPENHEFPVNSEIVTYATYENVNSCVLDLDKGVPVTVSKGSEDDSYGCDSQILQRYLHDASMALPTKEDNDQSVEYLPKPHVSSSQATGVSPKKLGVKYEDCDFNSSDSFASTESIIPKTIKCPQCPKTFMFKADMTRHKKLKHLKQKLFCRLCNKEFPSQQNLLFHERSHEKPTALTCHDCKKTFKTVKIFGKHMTEVHGNSTPFLCLKCSKSFRKVQELANHHRKVHNTGPAQSTNAHSADFSCPICGKVFERKQNVSFHMKTHKEAVYTCNTCGKVFEKANSWRAHIKRHAAPAQSTAPVQILVSGKANQIFQLFKCPRCPQMLNDIQSYEAHLSSHTTISCEICKADFSSNEKLAEHQIVHKKQRRKKFECTGCELVFSTKKAMTKHAEMEHKPPTTQEICTQTDLYEMQNMKLELKPMSSFNCETLILTTDPSTMRVPYSTSS